MKKLQSVFAVVLAAIVLFISCKKDIVSCNPQQFEKSVMIRTGSDFAANDKGERYGPTASRATIGSRYYTQGNNDSIACFVLFVYQDSICSSAYVNLNMVLLLNQQDTSILFGGRGGGGDNPISNTYLTTVTDAYYHADFRETDNLSYGMEAIASFRSKGSRTADSTFFFSNLSFMGVTLRYKLTD